MNVFRINDDPAITASQLADRHVRKMVLEGAQILSTAVRLNTEENPDMFGPYSGRVILDIQKQMYRVAHRHHPITVYATSKTGALDVLRHSKALFAEYRYRWNKVHASEAVILQASVYLPFFPERGADSDCSTAPLCVDEDLRTLSAYDAYRAHLDRKYNEWKRPPLWTNRERPEWVTR